MVSGFAFDNRFFVFDAFARNGVFVIAGTKVRTMAGNRHTLKSIRISFLTRRARI